LSPNPLEDYCAIESIDDPVIQQMLDDYCAARQGGRGPQDAYEELLREYEALDLNREHHPERDSDELITGWWMASNPGWWNGRDRWSDDAVVAMLVANDNTDNPAPGTEAWDERVERWEENGFPASDSEVPSIQGMMQQDYESDLQGIWAENNMDSLYDVLLFAGLETGTIYDGPLGSSILSGMVRFGWPRLPRTRRKIHTVNRNPDCNLVRSGRSSPGKNARWSHGGSRGTRTHRLRIKSAELYISPLL
jgi:hypothetical protein